MPPLAATARTTVRGEKNVHVGFTDPLENRAWALWLAVRTGKARVAGTAATGPAEFGLSGTPGLTVEVNMTTKMKSIWDELASADKVTQASFASELRQFLRASGNAVCLRSPGIGSGDHGQPLWWIRDEWNDAKAVGVFKQTELTSREKRLTPQEAGEDREPAPVTVRQLDMAAAEDEQASSRVEEFSRLWEERRDAIVKVLREADYPLYQSEISERSGVGNWAVGRVVREMVAAGDERVSRRVEVMGQDRPEEVAGRKHYLYWHSSPVPPRDPSLFHHTQSLMDKVNALKPGQWMTTRWITGGVMKEVQELIEAGILILKDEGTDNERIMLAEGSGVESVEAAIEETEEEQASPAPLPAESTLTDLDAIQRALASLVETEVSKVREELREDIRRARADAKEWKQIAEAKDAELVELREYKERVRTLLG